MPLPCTLPGTLGYTYSGGVQAAQGAGCGYATQPRAKYRIVRGGGANGAVLAGCIPPEEAYLVRGPAFS